MISMSEFGLVVAREVYAYKVIDQTVLLAATFAVLLTVFISSKLTQNEEKSAERLY